MSSIAPPQPDSRVWSLDIFRGLTMLVMIFVNDVAGVQGLPWWTYHMKPHQNGMTYVDMVFPFFLFIVGMALPLAIRRRLAKGDSMGRLWFHIVTRSLSLIVIGVFLANAGRVDPQLTGIGPGLFGVLGLVGFVLLWNSYPRSENHQTLYKVLKGVGLLIVVVLFAIFRAKDRSGATRWLQFGYPEILGLIGRAYLASCILYIPLRKKTWGPLALLVGLTAVNTASHLNWLPFLSEIPYWLWPFDAGEFSSLIMAGVVCSSIFLETTFARDFQQKARLALIYAALLLAAGWALSPLGISKLGATPSWCLLCSGAAVLLFLALYWFADVKHQTKWTTFLKPAGSNTLLTYLLPDIFYYAGLGALFPAFVESGWPGVVKSFLFVAFILASSAVLTKCKVRMQL